ncbi:ferredoxin [Candidatus Saganbacteria bacterium]|nr:ferredoxin [Candidatus Saganbacteria bacterium]
MSNVKVNDGCILCGVCESVCPEIFKMGDSTTEVIAGDFNKLEIQIREAAQSCPVSVIEVTD